MARLDELVEQIGDAALRRKVQAALGDLKRRQRFGLVFEEHIPETTVLHGLPVYVGSLARLRTDVATKTLYRVKALTSDGEATIEPADGGDSEIVASHCLVPVKQFGEAVFPTLTPLGSVHCGPEQKPHHAVINGENYHALELLRYLYAGKADCIYIDPPYNTGARDWTYNNRYVDKNDSWRHSKWLSMMEKRLRLSKVLLKKDGVLILTIDENEVHHIGMLLESIFPEYLRYMLSIVINPKGRDKANFAPVEEYAFFVVPDLGKDVILRAPIVDQEQTSFLSELFDDAESDLPPIDTSADPDLNDAVASPLPDRSSPTIEWEWRHARRRGGGAEASSYREKRPNQFYPIYIDEVRKRVVKAGDSIPLTSEPNIEKIDGLRPIWPIDRDGRHRCWAFVPASMQQMIDKGNVALGKYHALRDDWTINYRVPKKSTRKLKTVWWEKSHDAGTHGTELLKKLLGQPGLFPFPKSVYAVHDCLAAVVRDRPNAVIIDFFAGSGTTFHATCLLNAEDGGHRRSVMVTNNEVSETTADRLNKEGLYPGDADFEKHGIFEQVTRPRSEAVVTGRRPDGSLIPGSHINGRVFSMGFPENVDFYRLDYLDPDDVDLGRQFEAILPCLWLAAGGVGPRESETGQDGFILPTGSTYGVLFKESRFRRFLEAVRGRDDITHVWLVTDSDEAFAEMRSALPARIVTSMLYRDYLRSFRINSEQGS